MRKNRSSTPCIGICSTTFGDDVCKGCKRFSHEITNWGKFSTDERAVVNSRLEQFKITILEEKFIISDSNLFESKMNEFSIIFIWLSIVFNSGIKMRSTFSGNCPDVFRILSGFVSEHFAIVFNFLNSFHGFPEHFSCNYLIFSNIF